MYQTFRNMTVNTARMQDAIGLITMARDRLNSEHGGNYAVSVAVGGDPSAVTLSSPFETLGQYETMRAAAAQDPVGDAIDRMREVEADRADAVERVEHAIEVELDGSRVPEQDKKWAFGHTIELPTVEEKYDNETLKYNWVVRMNVEAK